MTRKSTEAYGIEYAFLQEMLALTDRELAHRAGNVSRSLPHLADEIRARIQTPLQQWREPVDPEIVMAFRGLKLEQALIADLMGAIEQRPLVVELERRIGALERQEMEIIRQESGAQYLHDAAFWNDEDALAVLNRLFTHWARWARGEPLEGP